MTTISGLSVDPLGPVEQEVVRRAPRYAALVRLGIAVLCVPLATLAVPGDRLPTTAVAVLIALGWSGYLMWRTGSGCTFSGRLLVADLVLTGLVCLSQAWTVPPGPVPHGNTWVCVFVTVVVVTHQWNQPLRRGMAAAVVVVALDATGMAIARPGSWVGELPTVGWIFVEALLSLMALRLLYRGSRAVDRAIRRTADARASAGVAQARQEVERAHLAALHDTACATLMVAAGASTAMEVSLLRAQARRDLGTLRGTSVPAGEVDLAAALAEELRHHPIEVHAELGPPLPVPAAVATAVRQAAAEALRNVNRHAGVATARLCVAGSPDAVAVEINDDGVGFVPDLATAHHRGLTHSVLGRMVAAGGRAQVRSQPGCGTTVRLEWPDAG